MAGTKKPSRNWKKQRSDLFSSLPNVSIQDKLPPQGILLKPAVKYKYVTSINRRGLGSVSGGVPFATTVAKGKGRGQGKTLFFPLQLTPTSLFSTLLKASMTKPGWTELTRQQGRCYTWTLRRALKAVSPGLMSLSRPAAAVVLAYLLSSLRRCLRRGTRCTSEVTRSSSFPTVQVCQSTGQVPRPPSAATVRVCRPWTRKHHRTGIRGEASRQRSPPLTERAQK